MGAIGITSVYKIPILSIQDFLVYMDSKQEVVKLKKFCRENISPYEKFNIEFNLDRQWYPEVITTDKHLAWKLIQKYGGK